MHTSLTRIERLRAEMRAGGVEAALIGLGPDLEYLTGYRAHALERLTMLVVATEAPAVMVLPALEAMHFEAAGDGLLVRSWAETEDPIAIVVEVLGPARRVAVSDETWARFVVDLLAAQPSLQLGRAAPLTAPLRMRKDATEIRALREVGACVDRVLGDIQAGLVPLVGRSERDVANEISTRLLEAGHESVEFRIVASGPNAASPHHEPGDRVIESNEIVLFDIGGRRGGYSSDCTRCVATGPVPAAVVEAYRVLRAAQAAGVAASRLGSTCADVDRAARGVIEDAGWGERFIHRTGHGIGLAGHEEPYIVEGNNQPLEAGFAFSVEPGIYVPGEWGMRIEDIVVVEEQGPVRCNLTTTELVEI